MRVFGGKGIRRIYEVKDVLEARSGRRFAILLTLICSQSGQRLHKQPQCKDLVSCNAKKNINL